MENNETAEQANVVEENKEVNFLDLLKEVEGAPDKAAIDAWKNEHGDVFCSGFSDTELFIWRSLNRREWKEHQNLASQSGNAEDTMTMEEDVVQRCILWASEAGTKSLQNKAGTFNTLHEQLLQNSNFVAPQYASNLVVKL